MLGAEPPEPLARALETFLASVKKFLSRLFHADGTRAREAHAEQVVANLMALVGRGGGMMAVRREVTAAELGLINSAPISLIPAMGPHTIVWPLYAAFELDVQVPYTSSLALRLAWEDSPNTIVALPVLSFVAPGRRLASAPVGSTTYAYELFDPRGRGVVLRGTSNPVGEGQATGVLTVTYVVSVLASPAVV